MQQNTLKTLNYAGIFLSCYTDYSEKCIHATPEHVLVYVYSGEQIIEDRNKKTRVKAGQCVFIRRNHQLVMHKNSAGNEHYKDDLTIEQMATYTGRSLATFKRDFKKVSTLTPQKWIIKKRLETAYIKLKEERAKVQDVYWEVGFKNPSHFSTAFKKQYGIPPSEIGVN